MLRSTCLCRLQLQALSGQPTESGDEWIVIFAFELQIVVPFSLFASLDVLFFPVQYSPSTQNEQCVVQNRALDHRLLSVANWCRTPLAVVVHSARSQGMSTRHRIQGISRCASPLAVWLPPSRHTPCSALPSLTSTTIPSLSWLADERSQSDGPSENRSEAHAARTDV